MWSMSEHDRCTGTTHVGFFLNFIMLQVSIAESLILFKILVFQNLFLLLDHIYVTSLSNALKCYVLGRVLIITFNLRVLFNIIFFSFYLFSSKFSFVLTFFFNINSTVIYLFSSINVSYFLFIQILFFYYMNSEFNLQITENIMRSL